MIIKRLFLGWSLVQIPDLLITLHVYLKKLIGPRKSEEKKKWPAEKRRARGTRIANEKIFENDTRSPDRKILYCSFAMMFFRRLFFFRHVISPNDFINHKDQVIVTYLEFRYLCTYLSKNNLLFDFTIHSYFYTCSIY